MGKHVHNLTGSSPSTGAVPSFLPIAMPLAGPRIGAPDAEVIDLAQRVKALAERDCRAHGRLASVLDHIQRKVGFAPKRPTPPIGLDVKTEIAGDRHVTTLTRPLETPERDAILAAHDAVVVEHERQEAEFGDHLGLPALDRRVGRMFRRLVRWSKRLTVMAPSTSAGLAAKAAASIAITDGGNSDEWTTDLANSVSRDAVRLTTGLADGIADPDAELIALIAQHGPALAAWHVADEAADVVRDAYWKAEPPRPQALYGRLSDGTLQRSGLEKIKGSTTRLAFYTEADVKKLRLTPVEKIVETHSPAPWNPNETVVHRELVIDEAGEARRYEIVAAWRDWEDEKDAVRESTGLNAANDRVEAAGEVLNSIEDAILNHLPRTFGGLQAKARWIASTGPAKQRAEQLMLDLLEMPSPPTTAPVPQAEPSRDVVETYRTFLDQEFRWLNWETHQHPEAIGGIWLDNPAARLHGGDGPPPSSRATAVLSLLGLMPDRASEALAEAHAASRAA